MREFRSLTTVDAQRTRRARQLKQMRRWLRDFETREAFDAYCQHEDFDEAQMALLTGLLPARLLSEHERLALKKPRVH